MAEIEEARHILEALGLPAPQYNEMSGMTLIALCGLTPDASWLDARRRSCTITKGIMNYLKEHYGVDYAPNTRETFHPVAAMERQAAALGYPRLAWAGAA